MQDSKRFAGLLKAFLTDFIGQAEPGSRHVCLHFDDVGSLTERINSFIGDNLENEESHKIPHVGFYVDPVFSSIINKNNNKNLHLRKYNLENQRNEQKNPHNTGSRVKNAPEKDEDRLEMTLNAFFRFVGFRSFFDSETSDNTASSFETYMRENVGYEKKDIAGDIENSGSRENPTPNPTTAN
ncbi:hypothetical protein [Thermoplasma volcanium]|uniref:hypothetical protein n=1 Tax=Thermoplasma volcanium TaxID=50339 RepID=UPI00064EE30F|nr:hypothetical protein [Thermoplasma volcanium]